MRQDDPSSVSSERDNSSCRGNKIRVQTVLTIYVPCSRALFSTAGQAAPSFYRRSGRFILHPTPNKKNLPFLLFNACTISSWSSLEERREEEEPSTELPRRHHYFKMFKPPFDGLPLMTVTFQEVGCGLIHEPCRNWTNTKDGLFLSYWGQL